MQAQCQLVVYTEQKLCCLASNTYLKLYSPSYLAANKKRINTINRKKNTKNKLIVFKLP